MNGKVCSQVWFARYLKKRHTDLKKILAFFAHHCETTFYVATRSIVFSTHFLVPLVCRTTCCKHTNSSSS